MVKLARGRRGEARQEPTAARACAYRVLERTFGEGAYADRAFRAEADRAGLDSRERAFAQRLAYGAIQNRRTLDYVIVALSSRGIDTIDPPLLNALRLGVYQLALLDGVPHHAAVGQTVDLAKQHGHGGHRFVNAVMRRAAREATDLIAALTDNTPADAAVRHSHPEWVVRMWWGTFGREETVALLERDNSPAENALRANELLVTADEVSVALAEQGVKNHVDRDIPEALVLSGQFDAHGSKLFKDGAIMPQSRGSMLVARTLAPESGDRVLDMCAAPGAKTSHIAALLGNQGQVLAVEKHGGRAKALEENCARLGATCVTVREADAAQIEGEFDRVLLDPPCSDLGTLQARPDVRWKKSEADLVGLVAEQVRLLDAAADRVRPGGTLVYSTCTISPDENENQIERFLDRHRDFRSEEQRQLMPHRDGTDGFFIARLARTG
jgi:16S rRNA (cytosine967-C5)-methyltransferase